MRLSDDGRGSGGVSVGLGGPAPHSRHKNPGSQSSPLSHATPIFYTTVKAYAPKPADNGITSPGRDIPGYLLKDKPGMRWDHTITRPAPTTFPVNTLEGTETMAGLQGCWRCSSQARLSGLQQPDPPAYSGPHTASCGTLGLQHTWLSLGMP